MKKFKFSFVAILAIVIALAGSAYTVNYTVKKTDPTYFYKYIGTGTSDPDLLLEANWVSVENPTVTGCSNDEGVNCVIELTVAPDESEHPDLDGMGIDTRGELDNETVTFKD